VTRRGITATDRLMAGFLAAFTATVLGQAGDVPSWPLLIGAVALFAALIALLARGPADSGFVRFVGGAYPVLFTPVVYTLLGVLNVEAARFHDGLVQHWEVALFGSQLSVTWHQAMPSIALSWVLHLGYWSYYFIVATAVLGLWFRAPPDAYARGAFIITLGFYLCYLVFILFPVMGPRHFFGDATGAIAEILPARLMRTLQQGGSAMGTAFPSSHVVACWLSVYALWRDLRRLALLLAPAALALALGTVYGQFHYAVDAVAGAALAVLLALAADPLRRALTRPETPPA
jgi:membrane-associated phospholipid phosphatase